MMGPMIEPVFDKDCFKILSMFSISPGSRFKRNEIKANTKQNNVTLDRALTRLVNSKIIGIDRNYYFVNFENDNARKMIDIVSGQYKGLRELPLNVFLLIVDLIDVLSTKKRIEVYLFGSYAKLIYREQSDVDIAVLLPAQDMKIDFDRIAQKLEKVYGKHVEIHDFEKESFYQNKNDPMVSDILRNGIRLL
ncbi:MAG: Nucleotidyltransferase domain protein [Methanocella sp. PtaU1.Bin125]|nr:MAG: Nucleotidyltransferase domain protein [Methanocella sp. PtaU1.Bin125]